MPWWVKCLRLIVLCAATCLAAATASSGAADLTLGIDAGQIRLVKGEGVRPDWKDLYISPEEVRVSHQFTNTGAEDVVTVVAFALAPIDFEAGSEFAVDAGDPRNIVGFDLTVDGAKVTPDIDVTAVRNGRNITPVLVKHGVPLIPFAAFPDRGWDAYFDRIGELSEAAREDLEKVDALSFDDPTWTAHVIYYWTVRFPPNQPVEIGYRYVPVPAIGLLTREALADREIAGRYCLDKNFVSRASAWLGPDRADGTGAAVAQYVRYLMITPDLQPVPIGRFYLTVDRGTADTLVSMCASGAVKTGETAVRLERFDFVPDKNIDILFVRRPDPQ